jgi:hypothetical protein
MHCKRPQTLMEEEEVNPMEGFEIPFAMLFSLVGLSAFTFSLKLETRVFVDTFGGTCAFF